MIKRERRGDYLGKTVQMVPHVTDMVQSWLREVSKIPVDGTGLSPDVCLIEVGGTVGDIESMIFLEALRQFQFTVGRENMLFVHVSLVPVTGGEAKSKPTQHSAKELRALGLSPDVIVCRAPEELSTSIKQKISTFCHVPPTHIISNYDVKNIYHVPLVLEQQGIHRIVKKMLHLEHMSDTPDLSAWRDMAAIADDATEKVNIGIVGKYISHPDSYLSLVVALKHSAILLRSDVVIHWIEATDLEDSTKVSHPEKFEEAWSLLRSMQGILIPGGFGIRGIQGKVNAAKYARESRVPCLGICLGLQVMVIEYARNVLQWENANSAEFDEGSPHPVVVFMPEINQQEMGGTMRLGVRGTTIVQHVPAKGTDSKELSLAGRVYGIDTLFARDEARITADKASNIVTAAVVLERHRHRYEVNPDRVSEIEQAGLFFTGRDDEGVRMEIAELPTSVHPFYFGVQFHPEVKSRPTRPSPPIFAFCAASAGRFEDIGKAGQLWQDHEESLLREVGELNRVQHEASAVTNRLVTKKRSISESYSSSTAVAGLSSPSKKAAI